MRHGGREPACDTPTAGMSYYFIEGNSLTFGANLNRSPGKVERYKLPCTFLCTLSN